MSLRRLLAAATLAPPMTDFVQSFLPPSFVSRNPDFPIDAGALTGSANIDIRTAQPSGDAARILAHSYEQACVPDTQIYGVHLNGADRTGGASASIDPMYDGSLTRRRSR